MRVFTNVPLRAGLLPAASFFLSAALLTACSGAAECGPESHCHLEDGRPTCDTGYAWEDASDDENLRCIRDSEAPCQPTTCLAEGKSCGAMSDGCGAELDCGRCAAGLACVANACSCVPTTCAAEGRTCGTLSDGCGGTLSCGPQSCDDWNACTDDQCNQGVCEHHPKADLSPCGYYLNEACKGGTCVVASAYCVDDDPEDFWNGERYSGPGYNGFNVDFCRCDAGVLHADFDTQFSGTMDLANISCGVCGQISRTASGWSYDVTLCL